LAFAFTSPLPYRHNVSVELVVEHAPSDAWLAVGLAASTVADSDLLSSPHVVGVASTAAVFGNLESGQPGTWGSSQRLVLALDRSEEMVTVVQDNEDGTAEEIVFKLPRGALRVFVAMEGCSCAVTLVEVKTQPTLSSRLPSDG
jgi:hypothetical protein